MSDGGECSKGDEAQSKPEEISTEIAVYRNCAINLPLQLFENSDIIRLILNCDTWALLFDDEERDHLRQYLPHFPHDSYHLQELTVDRLLNGENFKFGNPVKEFHKKLQRGDFNPRISQLLATETQASYAKYKLKRQRYYKNLLAETLLSRRSALHDAAHAHTAFVTGVKHCEGVLSEREVNFKNNAQLEYEKIWLSVKISERDYSNSSDEEETFESRLIRHTADDKADLSLKDMLSSYRKRRNSHILYPDLITEKVTLLSVKNRVQKREKKRRCQKENSKKKALLNSVSHSQENNA